MSANDSQGSAFASRERIGSFLFDYVASQTGLFLLSDVVAKAVANGLGPAAPAGTSRSKRLRRDPLATLIAQILDTEGLAFPEPDHAFMPVPAFFQGAEFLISPTAEEIAQQILVPGHRFMPFLRTELSPWEATLIGPEGIVVAKKKVEEELAVLHRHFAFFGIARMMYLLSEDDKENSRRLAVDPESEPRVLLTVFDFRAAYASLGFRPGDALLCMLASWKDGTFTYRKVPAEDLAAREADRDAWVDRLEKSLCAVFDSHGPLPAEAQLSRALYGAGRSALRNPPLHFGGFLAKSGAVRLQPFGRTAAFWHADRNPEDDVPWEEAPASLGLDGSLDDILSDIGCALCSEEIEAYMRDQLFSRRGGLAEVSARILLGRVTVFHDPRQEKAFHRLLEERWAAVTESYKYSIDRKAGRLRKRVLDTLDRHLAWVRGMDTAGIDLADLPREQLMAAVAPSHMLTEIAMALNVIGDSKLGADVEKGMSEALDGLDETLAEIQSEAEGSEAPSHMIIMKIALKGITPQIMRRIAVPASFTLSDLHDLIQEAMGWGLSHLHCFIIDGEEYSNPEDVDFQNFDSRDERDVVLGTLFSSPRKTFTYVYDFGDNWRHAVSVERFMPLAPDAPSSLAQPTCLAGRRACPLEDCGGIPGYYGLVEALACPEAERTEEMRELLDWAGGWQPEHFDMEEANRAIARAFPMRNSRG